MRIGESTPAATHIAAAAFAFATLVVVVVVIASYVTGTVKLKGLVLKRSDSPVGFWVGIAIWVLVAALCVAISLFGFVEWFGWWHRANVG